MTADTFLFNAGSLFFAAWIAVIAGLTLTAFGRDLLPSNKIKKRKREREQKKRRKEGKSR